MARDKDFVMRLSVVDDTMDEWHKRLWACITATVEYL